MLHSGTLATEAGLRRLAGRLRALGHPLAELRREGEVRALLIDRGHGSRAVVVPTALASAAPERVAASLAELRAVASGPPPTLLAFGAVPPLAARRRLRACGVELALYEPLETSVLRFQVNRALRPPDAPARCARRAPFSLEVPVRSALRRCRLGVYSLSSRGAFLVTDSPPRVGRRLELELPAGLLRPRVRARVVMTNPDSGGDRGVPPGMALRFRELDAVSAAAIDRMVDDRLSQLRV